ncbi:right-handed parallel beta-helix repeat-containing protein [Phenylobacterium sp.]|uniref:right-handed parallel beta-helix repeat-containing protein n=1 Tax=Phenylobacterium sp. TaxID=1871053 RepID=UPI003567C69A
MNRFRDAIYGVCLLLAAPASAGTVTVSSTDAAYAAVKADQPGDVVLLAAGVYGALDLSNLVVAAPGVTVKPAPGANVLLGQVTISNSQGLNLSSFEVVQSPASWMSSVYVTNSSRINLDGLHVHQSDPAISSNGVQFRDTTDSSLTNSQLDHLGVAGLFIDAQRLTVAGNSVAHLTADGFDFAGVGGSLIDGNRLTDFNPAAGVHDDAIQFWGTANNPSPVGNVVSNNVISRGDGVVVQGVFAESQASLTITGNAMTGTMFNGISVSSTKGATISGNFVQGWADMGSAIVARGGSSDVTVGGNTISSPVNNVPANGTELAVINFVLGQNAAIAPAAVGDTSAMEAWLKAKAAPVVTPPPDPRDVQIVALTVQLATARAQLTSFGTQVKTLQGQATAAQAATAAANAKVAALRNTLSALGASVAAALK